jgi:hypothetical protein
MSDWTLRSPVAFIVFNRPELTLRSFAAIAVAKPPILLVVADGARTDRPGEAERVAHVRSIVSRVDWECDVRTSFSETNLGCRRRVSSGLDWVFGQVPSCIVLEDDCLADQTFFRFCDELLERYRDDKRIFHINGTNFHDGGAGVGDSYFFSSQSYVWGWATWADRWVGHYDVDVSAWARIRRDGSLEDVVGGKDQAKYWGPILDRLYRGEIDTWDYQWAFACMLNGAATAIPNVNLIANMGFGEHATHTYAEGHPLADMETRPMQFPLRHPIGLFRRSSLDRRHFDRHFSVTFKQRVINRLRRLVGYP